MNIWGDFQICISVPLRKAAFVFNNQLVEQLDVVLMDSSRGHVSVNMVMIELEEVIVKPLQQDGLVTPHALCLLPLTVMLCVGDAITLFQQLNSLTKIYNLP